MRDMISMKVVGCVVTVRRFAKGLSIRVQAEVKDGVKVFQGVTVWDNDGLPEVEEGDRVYAEGYPKINSYETKEGETKSTIDCVARKFQVLNNTEEDEI